LQCPAEISDEGCDTLRERKQVINDDPVEFSDIDRVRECGFARLSDTLSLPPVLFLTGRRPGDGKRMDFVTDLCMIKI